MKRFGAVAAASVLVSGTRWGAVGLPVVDEPSASSCVGGDEVCATGSDDIRTSSGDRAGDHMMLQSNHRLGPAQKIMKRGPADVLGNGCHGMPDVERSCARDNCKVLATEMTGYSCTEFCHRSGRQCLAAWEEVDETCGMQEVLTCDQVFGTTSDLLCMCSPQVVGLTQNVIRDANELELIWADEFDGSAVDTTKWNMIHGGGGFGNQELQHYTPRTNNARVQDGILTITAQCERYGYESFTSAKLTTEKIVEWGPGHRVDVRAKMPRARGTWPAIWMLPTDSAYGEWPASGEIDIVEAVGCTEGKIYGTVHTGAYNHMQNSQAYNSAQLNYEEWHTYSIRWESNGIEWYVDDVLFGTFAPSEQSPEKWPFSKNFYLILNLAVGGSWGGSCLGGQQPSCSDWNEFGQPQLMEVDFARVYRIKG